MQFESLEGEKKAVCVCLILGEIVSVCSVLCPCFKKSTILLSHMGGNTFPIETRYHNIFLVCEHI